MTERLHNTDEVFECYVRDAKGNTSFLPLREALKQFLDLENGYRLSINIEGVVLTLRNEWDIGMLHQLDEHLGHKTIEAAVTIRGL